MPFLRERRDSDGREKAKARRLLLTKMICVIYCCLATKQYEVFYGKCNPSIRTETD